MASTLFAAQRQLVVVCHTPAQIASLLTVEAGLQREFEEWNVSSLDFEFCDGFVEPDRFGV